MRTVRNHDRLAVESVALAGFEVLAPRVREKVGAKWRTLPLFPGYFFVRVVDRWRALERSLGVLCVVKVGATPARCPDAEIAALLERSDADGVIRLRARPSSPPPRRVLAPGAAIAVTGGPFVGLNGVYAGMSAREREMVLCCSTCSARPARSRSPPARSRRRNEERNKA